MIEAIAFYTFATLTILMFAITVMSKNALYSMSALAAGMIFISGFFFLLDADFLGVVQIIVYTGAVMALYAFGMMFFDTTRDVKEKNPSNRIVFALSGLAALLVVIIFLAPIISDKVQALYPMSEDVGNAEAVGIVLFTKYLIPFEVAAVMLLVAMISGIIMASKRMDVSLTLNEDDENQEKATQ
ncbi:MAG TPA: NADH-quinone oxidoreductase subunit J [Campylobacterales bacterium]|nr:NADH-quinone oxidoreductase subunit J [Campylobacterales bacterium]